MVFQCACRKIHFLLTYLHFLWLKGNRRFNLELHQIRSFIPHHKHRMMKLNINEKVTSHKLWHEHKMAHERAMWSVVDTHFIYMNTYYWSQYYIYLVYTYSNGWQCDKILCPYIPALNIFGIFHTSVPAHKSIQIQHQASVFIQHRINIFLHLWQSKWNHEHKLSNK